MATARAVALHECLAKYRQHAGSLTGRARITGEYRPGRAHGARFVFLTWLQTYLREQGMNHPGVDAAVYREFWPLRHPHLNRCYEAVLDLRRWTRRTAYGLALRILPRQIVERTLDRYLHYQQAKLRKRAARKR
jgi:hypothetical protein